MAKAGRPKDPELTKLLDAALALVKASPYPVSLRHVFYQLLDNHFKGKKGEYENFKRNVATARKELSRGWEPNSLVDDTRRVFYSGWTPLSEDAALDSLIDNLEIKISHFADQNYYSEIWFESGGSLHQFEYLIPGFTLRPFRGSYSIEKKWKAAKDIEDAIRYFKKPVIIFYFGDCDTKGKQIPINALRLVKKWCTVPFDFLYGGLTEEQARRYGLRSNPDKPDQYQWEALSDDQAREVIYETVDQFADRGAVKRAEKRTEDFKQLVSEKLEELR